MATDIYRNVLPVVAAQDLPAACLCKAVTLGGTIAAAVAATAAGILVSQVNSGETASVAVDGLCKADLGTAISTVGWPLKITTSGWLAACASGDQSIGRAIALANSGDRSLVMLDMLNLGIWHG